MRVLAPPSPLARCRELNVRNSCLATPIWVSHRVQIWADVEATSGRRSPIPDAGRPWPGDPPSPPILVELLSTVGCAKASAVGRDSARKLNYLCALRGAEPMRPTLQCVFSRCGKSSPVAAQDSKPMCPAASRPPFPRSSPLEGAGDGESKSAAYGARSGDGTPFFFTLLPTITVNWRPPLQLTEVLVRNVRETGTTIVRSLRLVFTKFFPCFWMSRARMCFCASARPFTSIWRIYAAMGEQSRPGPRFT